MTAGVRTIIRCVLTFLVLGTLCIAALIASSLVSPDAIMDSIRDSRAQIEKRGDYPLFFAETPKYRYDGFTDSLMLMQSIPDSNLNAIENVVLAPYHAEGAGTGGNSPTASLLNMIDDPSTEQDRNYVLYWHGYVVPLRVLLTVFSPMTIIVLNCIVFAVLTALVFETYRRTGGLAFGITFIVALLMTFSWITPLGFQFFTSYLLAFLATLALFWLIKTERLAWIVPLFLAVGLLTAFFDFLTTPLLTFLLPLALLLLWRIKEEKEGSVRKVFSAGAAWLVGYAGFWATKWLMTAIVYSADYANSEFAFAITQRSGSEGQGLSYRFNAIYNNLYQLLAFQPDGSIYPGELFLLVGLGLAILAAIWWLLFMRSHTQKSQVKRALPMLLVAAGPYVWYFVISQHSTFHSWMTYRLQTASVLALIFFVLLSIDWAGLRNKRGSSAQ